MFDLYSERSTNFSKHKRRTTIEGIETAAAGLGRSQKEGVTICCNMINQIVTAERFIESKYKEAEVLKCWNVLKCCNCIYRFKYIFVGVKHNFMQLKYFNLDEFWFVPNRTDPRTAFSIHDFPDNLDPDLAEAEPAVDAEKFFSSAS